METSDQHRVRIDALREAGCKLAIDDFGTRLLGTELPAYLPGGSGEDRSLLRAPYPFNEQDRLLLDGIINIVHNLGMQVVIEGVETREQLNFLCQKVRLHPGVSAQPPAALRRSDQYLSLNRQGNEPGTLTTVS